MKSTLFALLFLALNAHAQTCPKPNPDASLLFAMIEDPKQGVEQVSQFLQTHIVAQDAYNERCEPPIYAATRVKKLEVVKFLFERYGHPNLNLPGTYLPSPYVYAFQAGNLAIADFMKSKGGTWPADSTKTDLLTASGNFTPDELLELIHRGANLRARDEHDRNALMIAAAAGSAPKVKVYLDNGFASRVNEKDDAKQTAVMLAAQAGSKDCVDWLWQKGADLNLQDKDGDTALMLATHNDVKVTNFLIEKGAFVNLLNAGRESALIVASQNTNQFSLDVVKSLVSAGALVNQKDRLDRTGLYRAAESGSEEVIRFLLAVGADRTLVGDWQETPYQRAVEYSRPVAIQNLLKF